MGHTLVHTLRSCAVAILFALAFVTFAIAQDKSDVPIPMPDNAADVEFDGGDGKLEFSTNSTVSTLAAFYRSAMKPLGWKETPSVINRPNMVVLDFSKGGKSVNITILQMGAAVNVTAMGEGLITAAGQAKADAQAADASPPSAEDLEAEEMGGFPVPKRHTLSAADSTPFRNELNANVPLALPVVLDFYRRELTSRKWTEDTAKTAIKSDEAMLVFNSASGPGILKLGRKNGETIVNFAVRKTEEATKAGVLPKPGQARVLFGNASPAAAVITINKQTINVGAGVGAKAPDGPSNDIAPGTYTYSIKSGSRSMGSEKIEIGADETWGIIVGPGGGLALRVY
jgi:hypothetical protein